MEGRQSCAAVDLLNNGAVQQRVATDKVRKEWPHCLPLVGPVVEGGPCG
jgi:hypothetical protein